MKIMIDGDSCCVMPLTERIAFENNIECHIYSDTSHIINPRYENVFIHIVDKGPNSVDFAITNNCEQNDIVITNDVGLATLILSKNGFAVSPYGLEFTNDNIMAHLNNKFIKSCARRQPRAPRIRNFGISTEKKNYKRTLMSVIKRMENTT